MPTIVPTNRRLRAFEEGGWMRVRSGMPRPYTVGRGARPYRGTRTTSYAAVDGSATPNRALTA